MIGNLVLQFTQDEQEILRKADNIVSELLSTIDAYQMTNTSKFAPVDVINDDKLRELFNSIKLLNLSYKID